jgi:ribulose-5-phosphate 4-epimerase/fuculose-1-phosphate aldolase
MEGAMTVEAELRDKIATLTRIFAMRGLLGIHGHVSLYDPEAGRIYMCPGFGWDKANTRPEDLFVFNLQGDILEGQGRRVPIEWPIHTALHAARPDVLAVAHLHSPFATAFAVARREFRPVLLAGALYANGVPIYPERHLITTHERGEAVARLIGPGRAALLRNHGGGQRAGGG